MNWRMLAVNVLAVVYAMLLGRAFKWTAMQTILVVPGLSFFMYAVVVIGQRVK